MRVGDWNVRMASSRGLVGHVALERGLQRVPDDMLGDEENEPLCKMFRIYCRTLTLVSAEAPD